MTERNPFLDELMLLLGDVPPESIVRKVVNANLDDESLDNLIEHVRFWRESVSQAASAITSYPEGIEPGEAPLTEAQARDCAALLTGLIAIREERRRTAR